MRDGRERGEGKREETDRQTDRQTDRKREKGGGGGCVFRLLAAFADYIQPFVTQKNKHMNAFKRTEIDNGQRNFLRYVMVVKSIKPSFECS